MIPGLSQTPSTQEARQLLELKRLFQYLFGSKILRLFYVLRVTKTMKKRRSIKVQDILIGDEIANGRKITEESD